MRGKAYRRLLSARRRPLLVLLLVVLVLVVWRAAVVMAPRWVGVGVLALLLLSILVSVAVIGVRDRRRPAPSADPLKSFGAPPCSLGVVGDTVNARVVNSQLADQFERYRSPHSGEIRRMGMWDWVDDPEFLDRLAAAVARRERQVGR